MTLGDRRLAREGQGHVGAAGGGVEADREGRGLRRSSLADAPQAHERRGFEFLAPVVASLGTLRGWSATERYIFARECIAVDAPRGFAFFEEEFDCAYPFEKYDTLNPLTVRFTDLAPGTYTFRMKGSNSDGASSGTIG